MGGAAHGGRRLSLAEATGLATAITGPWLAFDAVDSATLAGSARRGLLECGDVDLVVVPKYLTDRTTAGKVLRRALAVAGEMSPAMDKDLTRYEKIVGKNEWSPTMLDIDLIRMFGFQKNGKPARSGLVDGAQVDVYLATHRNLGAMLAYATGSMVFNIQCRSAATRKGWLLNQYGIVKAGVLSEYRTEQEVFEELGVAWKEPQNR